MVLILYMFYNELFVDVIKIIFLQNKFRFKLHQSFGFRDC